MAKPDIEKLNLETRLAHAGRDKTRSEGAINPPVHRATTLLLDDVDDLYDKPVKTYGIDGMVVHDALRETLVAVEGGADGVLAPTGLAACALALLATAESGSDVLMTESVYKPTRNLQHFLRRFGVEVRFYDPRVGAGVADLIQDNTCALYMESPGSLTFEVQDVPAMAVAARARNVATIIDNTWSAGVYFKPFEHGVDLSVQALSKYQSGHADVFMGAVLARTPDWAERVGRVYKDLGFFVSPDDAFLLLRGMRSLAVRLGRQSQSALTIARWLEQQPQVARVLFPALESAADHALWKRDFSGASGLFGVVLKPTDDAKLKAMLEGLSLFGMGFSWGGFESLITPSDRQIARTNHPWRAEGPLLRLSIGLEHPDDLIADLREGLAKLS
ncbi:MAG: cystathionine beta-lyase [Hyphomonadaceae bacterium]